MGVVMNSRSQFSGDGAAVVRREDRRLACENSKFQIFFDRIKDGQGHRVDDYLVIVPRRKLENHVAGVAVLPVFDGKIGLLRIFRYPLEAYSLEIPRGFMEENEDAETAALRELREEAGLVCDRVDLVHLADIAPEAGVMLAKIRVFAATRCRITEEFTPSEIGHRSVSFSSVDEVDRSVAEGRILDPSTTVAFYRWLRSAA